MNIFDFAIDLKKEKEEFYRQQSRLTNNTGLKKVFLMLADEEKKHRQATELLKEDVPVKLAKTDVLSKAKEVFEQMKGSDNDLLFGVSQADIYRKAMEFEEKSWKYYEGKASQLTDEAQKQVLTKIASEDRQHYFLLENIVDFISKPQTWLENAEFCHLEDY